MPGEVQAYLVQTTTKAAADLKSALLRIPEDKRTWSPEGKARTALDQVAEVALLAGTIAEIMQTHKWPEGYSFDEYVRQKAERAQSTETALALLDENLPRATAAILSITDEDLATEVAMPWGPMSLGQIIVYPYWNMSYHEGQINYIASMLGCLS